MTQTPEEKDKIIDMWLGADRYLNKIKKLEEEEEKEGDEEDGEAEKI